MPRSLGGTEAPDNIVCLTAKQHFVCHHLLVKMCTNDEDRARMWNAFFLMHRHSTGKRLFIARTYEMAKREMATAKKRLTGERNHYYGRTHSEETRAKMRASWNRNVRRRFDSTIYTFEHPTHGRLVCTQSEFCKQTGIDKRNLSPVLKGRLKSTRGWRVVR